MADSLLEHPFLYHQRDGNQTEIRPGFSEPLAAIGVPVFGEKSS
jgi:hypothetical protein